MPASSKEILDIQGTIECGFTLKPVRDMTRIYTLSYSLLSAAELRDTISFPECGLIGTEQIVLFNKNIERIKNQSYINQKSYYWHEIIT